MFDGFVFIVKIEVFKIERDEILFEVVEAPEELLSGCEVAEREGKEGEYEQL